MTDHETRDEVVTLAVYPSTKEEWERSVRDDPNADNLSQLVRVAVNRHLHQSTQDGISDELHDQLASIGTQQDQIVQSFDEIKGQLTDIREAVAGSSVSPETKALASDIFELLPTEQDVNTDSVFADSEDGVPAPEHGSVEWLSDRLEVPRYQIQNALDHLIETTFAVQTNEEGAYFKEV